MAELDVSLIVTTYQRPHHLRCSLRSIALQRSYPDRFELIVTDDGSLDETPAVVEQFAARVSFPVTLVSHRHDEFRVARCRNNGVAVSRASYLLFLDGDCVAPPDHLAWHLRLRRPGHVVLGDSYRLDEAASRGVSFSEIDRG